MGDVTLRCVKDNDPTRVETNRTRSNRLRVPRPLLEVLVLVILVYFVNLACVEYRSHVIFLRLDKQWERQMLEWVGNNSIHEDNPDTPEVVLITGSNDIVTSDLSVTSFGIRTGGGYQMEGGLIDTIEISPTETLYLFGRLSTRYDPGLLNNPLRSWRSFGDIFVVKKDTNESSIVWTDTDGRGAGEHWVGWKTRTEDEHLFVDVYRGSLGQVKIWYSITLK